MSGLFFPRNSSNSNSSRGLLRAVLTGWVSTLDSLTTSIALAPNVVAQRPRWSLRNLAFCKVNPQHARFGLNSTLSSEDRGPRNRGYFQGLHRSARVMDSTGTRLATVSPFQWSYRR